MDDKDLTPDNTPTPSSETTTAEPVTEKKTSATRAQAVQTYERFVERLGVELKEAGKVGKKQWEDAVKSTRDFLQKARPPVVREEIEKIGETVKKDVRHALRSFRARGEEWTKSESFLTARDKGAQFLLRIAHKLKDAAESVETNLEEAIRYKKGEVVSGGTFTCADCHEEQKVTEAGPLTLCARCGKEDFRRKA
jgi:hypothetical protein